MRRVAALAPALIASALAGAAQAQETPPPQAPPTPFRRLPLQEDAYPAQHRTHLLLVEVQPNALIPRHTHPGIEMGYMLEGEADLHVDGQPNRRVKAGESYHIPAGIPHLLRNGPAPARVAVTYVVERDKPVASPAPLMPLSGGQ